MLDASDFDKFGSYNGARKTKMVRVESNTIDMPWESYLPHTLTCQEEGFLNSVLRDKPVVFKTRL